MQRVLGIDIRNHPSDEGLDRAEKVLPSSSTVPLNTDRSQPNVHENPSDGTRGTARSVLRSLSQVLFIISFSKPN